LTCYKQAFLIQFEAFSFFLETFTLKILNQNQIDLFIAPRFLLFAVAICIDSIRLFNRELPDRPLSLRLLSETGGFVPASNGVDLQTEAIADHDNAGTVIVMTSYDPEAAGTPDVLKWIRQQHRQGARMACSETAAYLFVHSKMFSSSNSVALGRLAAHYEVAPSYREMFGDRIELERLYHYEDNIHSSAGGMSTLDLMLHLIDELRDKTLSDRIAYVFNYQRMPDTACKPSRAEGAISRMDARLGRMVSLMQSSIGSPMPLKKIYLESGVEASTARRLFLRLLNQNPQGYYRQLRLQYGRDILQNSGFSISEAAEMTGFSDAAAFSRAYRDIFGITPGADRKSKLFRPTRPNIVPDCTTLNA
jgi:transcriptional regulator GlxA family with amidase domain